LNRQYGYPHNVISQGLVVAAIPLVEIPLNSSDLFDPLVIRLKRKWVEHKYGSITMVEAFQQELIWVQSKDPVIGEGTWNGAIEKEDIIHS
jgi:hypothetical protein